MQSDESGPPIAVAEPPSQCPKRSPGRRRWRDLRRSTRFCVLAFSLFLLCGFLELAFRVYWQAAKKVPALGTGRIWESYYAELSEAGLDQAPTSHDDETFDVLVLGASVWHRTFGDLARRLESSLKHRLNRPVRVFNLTYPGRTTLDSYLKYRRLDRQRYDLVVVYHGINDVYLNNCPPNVYRADYTHAPRYQQLLLLDRHPEHPWFVLPYSLRYAASRVGEQLNLSGQPSEQWHHHGTDLKTPPSFRANMEKILTLARDRGEPVLLMTFAYYVPDDYTEEAFAARQLDYDRHLSPLKLWGTVESVPRAIAAHNAAVRKLASSTPGTLFVDQQQLMPAGKRYYLDPCHFTPAGCEQFLIHLIREADWEKLEAFRGR